MENSSVSTPQQRSGLLLFPLVSIGLIVVCALLMTAYLLGKSSSQNIAPQERTEDSLPEIIASPEPSPTPEPSSPVLQEYKNEKLGFSLSLYPDESVMKETTTSVEFEGGGGRAANDPLFVVTKNITPLETMKPCTRTTLTAPCVVTYAGEKLVEDTQLGTEPARVFKVWRTVGELEIIVQPKVKPTVELRFDYLEPNANGWEETVKSFRYLQ